MKQNYKKTLVKLIVLCLFFFSVGGGAYAQASNDIRTQTVTIGFTNEPLREALFALGRSAGFSMALPSDVDASRLVNLPQAERTVEATLNLMLQGTNLEFRVQGGSIVFSERDVATASAQQLQVTGRVVDETGEPLPFVTVIVRGTTIGTVASIDGAFTITVPSAESTLQFSLMGYETIELPIDVTRPMAVRMSSDITTLEGVVVTGFQTISRERATGAYSIVTADRLAQRPTSNVATALDGLVPGLVVNSTSVDGQVRFTIRGQGTLPHETHEVDRRLNTDPLIVVDGFPIQGFTAHSLGADGIWNANATDPFNTINPNDIESITVLRDAAATSIFGARAANGVIVITTRRGRGERLNISASSFVSVSARPNLEYAFNMASTESSFWYLEHLMEFFPNYRTNASDPYFAPANPFVFLNDPARLLFEFRERGNLTPEQFNQKRAELIARGDQWKTDLNDLVFRNAVNQQYNISLRGGTERAGFSLSLSHDRENGSSIGNDNNRTLVNSQNRFNLHRDLTLDIGLNAGLTRSTHNGISLPMLSSLIGPWSRLVDENGDFTHIAGIVLFPNADPRNMSPWTTVFTMYEPIYMANFHGRTPVSWRYNPVEDREHMHNTSERFTARINAALEYQIIPTLRVRVSGQYERNQYSARMLYRPGSYFVRNFVNRFSTLNPATGNFTSFFPAGGIFNDRGTLYEGYVLRAQVDFNRSFGRHDIVAIAGSEVMSSTHTNSPVIWRYGYNENTNAVLTSLDFVNQRQNIFGVNEFMPFIPPGGLVTLEDRFFSVYGNVAYTFDDRYTISGSLRTDASNFQAMDMRSRFSPFWSVGASWIISREDFMSHIGWIDFLRLRTSFGEAGIAAGRTIMASVSTVGTGVPNVIFTNNEPFNTISARGNPTLTWEKSRTFDVGLEFRFWNNRLFGEITYYNRYSYDVLAQATVPTIAQGIATAIFNNAAISNTGIELSIGSRLNITRDLRWTGVLNYSHNRNEVREFHVLATGRRPNIHPGFAINSIWAYNAVGYTREGFIILEGRDGRRIELTDLNMINLPAGETVDTYNWSHHIGQLAPKGNLGFTSTFNFRGLTFSFLITGRFGHHFNRRDGFGHSQDRAAFSRSLERAIEVHKSGYENAPFIGRPLWNEYNRAVFAANNLWQNLPSITDNTKAAFLRGDHLRLSEVFLGYDIPGSLIGVSGIRNINVFAQARHLGLLWTANEEGIDPDFPIGNLRPPPTFTFGLRVNL